ncbi:verprolin [Aplysia californica]|uniref:Verprolin n=1 Tax=Aplysia californica TaxID=6500 RepID=A0ABM1AES3_APLCA|nr:verprolin [Aplysia californica]
MKEKKKRKKKSRASSRGGDVRGGDVRGGDVRREERAQASVCSSSKPNKRNRRSSSSVDMELMVKSSSASETFGKTSETSLTNEKRRSAPPGVLPVAIGVIHARPPWVPTKSPSSTGGCTTQTQCVIHEAPPLPPRCPINSANSKPRTPPGHPPRSNSHPPVPRSHPPRSRSSSSSVALPSVPSGGETYQNSRFQAADPSEAPTIPHAAAELPAAPSCRGHDSPRSSPDLCDTECAHAEYSNAPCEQDSLLRTTSCHSGCGSEHSFEDCSQCSYYDKLKCTTGSEGDLASLHTYQCLNGSSHDLTFDSSISGQFPSKSETYVNGSAVLLSQKQK